MCFAPDVAAAIAASFELTGVADSALRRATTRQRRALLPGRATARARQRTGKVGAANGGRLAS